MGWYYDYKELKTKEDYIEQLKEIIAYRELDGEDFDFGNGLIKNEMLQGSEDAYYEIDMQTLEDAIEYWEYDNEKKQNPKMKIKPHKCYFNQREKGKLKFLQQVSWMNVLEREGWLQRCYRGSRSKYLKKVSNRKVRKYKNKLSNGGLYKKVFDYWWELE